MANNHYKDEEKAMELEYERRALEDADKKRDTQREMTWFALYGLVLYPVAVILTSYFGLDKAAIILGDMAPTYFVAVAGIVGVYMGVQKIGTRTPPSDPTPPRGTVVTGIDP